MEVVHLPHLEGPDPAQVLDGKLRYGTAFGGDSVTSCSRVLVNHGFNYLGKVITVSPLTQTSNVIIGSLRTTPPVVISPPRSPSDPLRS